MSVIVEARCSDLEGLLEEHPELREEEVIAGSEELTFLLFPDSLAEHRGDRPCLFETLEETFGLEDEFFQRLDEEDEVSVPADQAVTYIGALLNILALHAEQLPQAYSLIEQDTGERYWETVVDGTTLQGGYDQCVALRGSKVEDLRESRAIEVNGHKFDVFEESVLAVWGKPLKEILQVALTAVRFGRDLVISVI
jgi:hypothetical protein